MPGSRGQRGPPGTPGTAGPPGENGEPGSLGFPVGGEGAEPEEDASAQNIARCRFPFLSTQCSVPRLNHGAEPVLLPERIF